MKNEIIREITQQMLPYLDNMGLEQLQKVLKVTLQNYEIIKSENHSEQNYSNLNFMELFLSAKRVEGCAEKTLKYYRATIETMLITIDKEVKHIVTDYLRDYLTCHQTERGSSRVRIDNIRRILSTFFSWLEDEDYIVKSPVRRIHKVKTGKSLKN